MSSSTVVLAFRREDMSMDADSSSGETRDGDPAWVPSKPELYKYKYKYKDMGILPGSPPNLGHTNTNTSANTTTKRW